MINLSSKNLCFVNPKYVRYFTGSLCGFTASLFVANPSYSSCTSTYFVDYSHKDTYNRPWGASLETSDSGYSVLRFGNTFYSEAYYFKGNGSIYRLKTCGYKCDPKVSVVKDLSAKGKCKITKLSSGKFDLSCVAVDKKGEKYSNGLGNAIKDKKRSPCYE
jgi:hypothetical protein